MAGKNVLGGELAVCSDDPKTGFYRDGCCHTGPDDTGLHIVCAEVTDEFLEFSAARGNDLVTPNELFGFPGLRAGDTSYDLKVKMDTIVFPSVEFADTPLRDVLEFLTVRSAELDTVETDPAKKGVSLLVKAPGETADNVRINLKLSNIPLSEILRYVGEQAGLRIRVEPYAIALVPLTDLSENLVTRSYRVPPTFLVGGSMESGAGGVTDPFAPPAAEDTSALAPKLSNTYSPE